MNLYEGLLGNPVNVKDPMGTTATITIDITVAKDFKVPQPFGWKTGAKDVEDVKKELLETDRFSSLKGYNAFPQMVDIKKQLKKLESGNALEKRNARRQLLIAGLYMRATFLREMRWWEQFLAKKGVFIKFKIGAIKSPIDPPEKQICDVTGEGPDIYTYLKQYAGKSKYHFNFVLLKSSDINIAQVRIKTKFSGIVIGGENVVSVWDKKKKKFVNKPAIYAGLFPQHGFKEWSVVRHELGHVLGLWDVKEGGGLMSKGEGGGFEYTENLGKKEKKLIDTIKARYPDCLKK